MKNVLTAALLVVLGCLLLCARGEAQGAGEGDKAGAAAPAAAGNTAPAAPAATGAAAADKGDGNTLKLVVRIVFEMASFVLLLWILTRLLYKPLSAMMRDRQAGIEKVQEEAAAGRKEAETLRVEYEQKLADAEADGDRIRAAARETAEEERNATVQGARDEAERIREAAQRKLATEREQAAAALEKDAVAAVVAKVAARVAKAPEAAAVRQQAVTELIRLLGRLDDKAKRDAAASLRGGEVVRLRSATPLEDAEKMQLVDAAAKTLGVEAPAVELSEDAGLVAGAEMRIGGVVLKAHWRDRIERAVDGGEDA
jgi:F-type H+-transporting ATPase subunit b